MKLLPFPGCCTAGILTGFGGTYTAEDRYRPEEEYTEDSMYQEIQQHLQHAHLKKWAMVFGTTNSQQKVANTVLPRIGFQKIQETAKDAHSEFTLLGWVFRLNPSDKVVPLAIPKNPFGKKKDAPVIPKEEAQPIYELLDEIFFDDHEDPEVNAPPQVQENFNLTAQGYHCTPWGLFQGMFYRVWYKLGERAIYEIKPEQVGCKDLPALWKGRVMEVRLHGDDDFQQGVRRGEDWVWDPVRNPGEPLNGDCITHFRFV